MQAWSCRYCTERRDTNLSFVHPAKTDSSFSSYFYIGNIPEWQLSWGTGLHCHRPVRWPSCKALVPIQDPVFFFTCDIRGSATACAGCRTFEGNLYINVPRLWGKVEKTMEGTQYTRKVIVVRRACWRTGDRVGKGTCGRNRDGSRCGEMPNVAGILTLSSPLLPVSYYCLPQLDAGRSQRTHQCWQYTTEKSLMVLNVRL